MLAFHASAGTFGKTAPRAQESPTALIGTNPVYGTNASGKIIITNTTNGPYFTRTEATWADSGTLEQLDTVENYVFLDRVVEGVAAGSAVAPADGDKWGSISLKQSPK